MIPSSESEDVVLITSYKKPINKDELLDIAIEFSNSLLSLFPSNQSLV